MFQATRRRLALWYTAVTAVVLLLFGTGVYMYVRSTLIERVDDTLNHVVEVVVRSLVIDPVNSAGDGKLHINLEASFPDNADTVEDDRIDLEWFSPTGELLWSTFSFPLNIPIHLNRTGETVRVVRWDLEQVSRGAQGQGSRGNVSVLAPTAEENYQSKTVYPKSKIEPSALVLRQVTERVEMGRQVLGYLRVSHPWFEVTKPSRQLIFDLSLGIGLMVISVAAIGWFLSGLAMKPVRESYQRLKQFTADASHELRSPIATIQTNVQVALADPDLEPQMHRQQLLVIERLTQRLGRLVDDLLFLARQDSGMVQPSFTPVPLDALLMEAIEEQRLVAASKNINLCLNLIEPPADITADISEEIYTLDGDWDQLARLFTNLVGNAVQYTLPGGRVDVELQQIKRHDRTQLQVKVKDTGIGIPEDALAHLFDRFYRVDPARSRAMAAGSGLGLAIASAIVENHKGHIRVESILDRGTIFTVTLPRRVGEQVSR